MHERFEIRVWKKYPSIWDESTWANHDQDLVWRRLELDEMMILDCLLPLHLPPLSQSPFSLSSSSLFLPSREREEGAKWKSERSWGCFSWEVTLQFCAYDRWGPEVSGGQLIFLSLLLFSLLADGPLNLPDCLVDLWFWEINPSTWGFGIGAMFTFQGVISWQNSI